MSLSAAELVALHRSTAMLTPGQTVTVSREELLELCAELLDSRRLIARLGTDLRTVAMRSRDTNP